MIKPTVQNVLFALIFLMSACGTPTVVPIATATELPTPQATVVSTLQPVLLCEGELFENGYSLPIGASMMFTDGDSVITRFCSTDFSGNATEYDLPFPVAAPADLVSEQCYIVVGNEDLYFTVYAKPSAVATSMAMKNGTYFVYSARVGGWYEVTFEANTYYLDSGQVTLSSVSCP